jgi:hypothetical protein
MGVDASAADDEQDLCPICQVAFQPNDACASDIELGTCHAACLEGAPVVDLETGDELPNGKIDTYFHSAGKFEWPRQNVSAQLVPGCASSQIQATHDGHARGWRQALDAAVYATTSALSEMIVAGSGDLQEAHGKAIEAITSLYAATPEPETLRLTHEAVRRAARAIWQTWQSHEEAETTWEDLEAAAAQPHKFPKPYEAHAQALDQARAALMAGLSTPAPETHVVAEQAGIAVLDCTPVGRTEREQEQNPSPKMNLPGVVAAQVPPATLSPCDAPRIVDEIDQRVSAHEHDVREEQLPEGFPGHNLPVPEAQDQYDGEGDGRSNAYGTKYGDDPCNHDGSPTLGSHTGIGIAVEPRLELALTATAPDPNVQVTDELATTYKAAFRDVFDRWLDDESGIPQENIGLIATKAGLQAVFDALAAEGRDNG